MQTDKEVLKTYLQEQRDALVWKLEGLTERDLRRPMTRSGTNLLGLVKHVGSVEAGYLGEVFGRPFPELLPWMEPDAGDNADMWATAEESSEQIVGFYRRVWAHSDQTIDELDLNAVGSVPWWSPDRREVTLQRALVHMIAETGRHAGHADIIRELIDGKLGMREGNENLPDHDAAWWEDYRAVLERTAESRG